MRSHFVFSRPILAFIVILALTSQACALSLIELPQFPGTSSTPLPSGPTPTPLPRSETKFTVRLPEPLPAGEVLALSVVDEVTGLALNPVDYQMTPVDAITYAATLPIPDQAVLKYRYIRRGAQVVIEDSNTDTPIRYRLMYISGPTQIVDTVSSWSDRPVNT